MGRIQLLGRRAAGLICAFPLAARDFALQADGAEQRMAKTAFLKLMALGALALGLAVSSAAQTRQKVDLELVLAVDVSASMDEDEHLLQRHGYAEAFRHRDLIAAIRSGFGGRIAVTYMEWAGAGTATQTIPWTIISNEAEARAFADRLDRTPIYAEQRTSISDALAHAARLFDQNAIEGARRVIDISGDGANNAGPAVTGARDAVVRRGVTINGLPIMLGKPMAWYDIPNLDRYYRDCVIGGAGAFVMPVHGAAEMSNTIRRKLVMEVAGLAPRETSEPLFKRTQARAGAKVDCLAGEKAYNSGIGPDGGFSRPLNRFTPAPP
jgi:hypothetical protein